VRYCPSVFIGSSTEGLDVAREVEMQLQHDAITTIWKDSVFGLSSGTLESLMNVLDQFDFAVMILSPDDLIESRSQSYASPRDNVLFELGLFMGRLGRSRVFIVREQDANLKLPSDLAGITVSPYRKRDNLSAALSPTCTPVIKAIRALGFSEKRAQQRIGRLEDQQEKLSQVQSRLESNITDILMSTVLDAYEYITLLKIAGRDQNTSYRFTQDKGQPLLERLRNRGLIEERGKDSIFKNKTNREINNIQDHFIITDQGRKFLDAIEDRGLGDALKKIVLPE
jgi:hypothetical protein